MQIKKTNEEIVNIRKTTSTDFLLTNSKGETKEIEIRNFTCDDVSMGFDNEETIWHKDEEITDFEDFITKFAGDENEDGQDIDADTVLDELHELITI